MSAAWALLRLKADMQALQMSIIQPLSRYGHCCRWEGVGTDLSPKHTKLTTAAEFFVSMIFRYLSIWLMGKCQVFRVLSQNASALHNTSQSRSIKTKKPD